MLLSVLGELPTDAGAQCLGFGRRRPRTTGAVVASGFQKAFIYHANGVERIVLQPSYQGIAKDFGGLLAVPEIPKQRRSSSGSWPDWVHVEANVWQDTATTIVACNRTSKNFAWNLWIFDRRFNRDLREAIHTASRQKAERTKRESQKAKREGEESLKFRPHKMSPTSRPVRRAYPPHLRLVTEPVTLAAARDPTETLLPWWDG